jgi:hypothetical protein
MRSIRRASTRPLPVVLAMLAIALGAAATPPVRPAEPVQLLVVSTQHWVGDGVLLVEVFDDTDQPLARDDAWVELRLHRPDGSMLHPVPAVRSRFARAGRDVYAAGVSLDQEGDWRVEAAVAWAGGSGIADAHFHVRPDEGTPGLGTEVPGGMTPTLTDARNLMAAITSDPEPVAAFYTSSVDRALANDQPFVFIIDSYAYRPNEACGGALGIVHDIYFEYPALTVIHAEPWRMAFQEGALTLDPPGGPPVLADWTRDWGVAEPPWIFVVGGDGRLKAKFNGIFGTDELRAAMASVTPWMPPG